jgi:hypothetical protein
VDRTQTAEGDVAVKTPPRLATWLLERLTPGSNVDALAGDLFEEYQRRRSVRWYWQQTAIAIAAGAWSRVRQHPALTLRAVVTTWIMLAATTVPFVFLRDALKPFEDTGTFDVRGTDLLQVWNNWMPVQLVVTTIGVSWLVARLHRTLGLSAPLSFCLSYWLLSARSLTDNAWAIVDPAPSTPVAFRLAVLILQATLLPLLVVAGGIANELITPRR